MGLAHGGVDYNGLIMISSLEQLADLTALELAQWCEGNDIQLPHWCAFLTDCCARPGEVAAPIDIDTARLQTQPSQPSPADPAD